MVPFRLLFLEIRLLVIETFRFFKDIIIKFLSLLYLSLFDNNIHKLKKKILVTNAATSPYNIAQKIYLLKFWTYLIIHIFHGIFLFHFC